MTTQPGEVFETAIWMTGEEAPELKERFIEDVRAYLAEVAERDGVVIGPLVMCEKSPGDDRVPPVPDTIQGPAVKLLVGEATVVAVHPAIAPWSFVLDLDKKDLHRLREITRQAAPGPLSDEECDEIIDEIGVETAVRTLREQVH